MIPRSHHRGPIILGHRLGPAKAALPLILAILGVLGAVAGCDGDARYMKIEDLTPDELLYVQRVVVLERAKAVALIDRPMGDVLLDSLAQAWGDSSLEKTLAAAPAHPVRAIQVNDLLKRVLEAELDSLIEAPRPDRLSAPLAEPLPDLPEDTEDS